MAVVDILFEQLDELEKSQSVAEDDYATATLHVLESKGKLQAINLQISALNAAISQITGEFVLPPTAAEQRDACIPHEVGNASREELLEALADLNSAPAENSSVIVTATELPSGPALDPNSKAIAEDWVKGGDGRMYPPGEERTAADIAKLAEVARGQALATGPACPGCGKRGTLQQMQHDSGKIFTACTACSNQIW